MGRRAVVPRTTQGHANEGKTTAARSTRQTSDRLPAAFAQLERLPAPAESRDRLVRALSAEQPSSRLLVETIESDIGLVVPAATLQLADLLVHYGDGASVTPAAILAAAARAGIGKSRLHELMPGFAGGGGERPHLASPLASGEQAALRGLARGQVCREIASERGTTPSTIRTQLHCAYKKLGVHDRAQAVLLAAKSGWL